MGRKCTLAFAGVPVWRGGLADVAGVEEFAWVASEFIRTLDKLSPACAGLSLSSCPRSFVPYGKPSLASTAWERSVVGCADNYSPCKFYA